MQKVLFILLVAYFSTFTYFVQAQTKVRFFSGSLAAAKQKASDEGKFICSFLRRTGARIAP